MSHQFSLRWLILFLLIISLLGGAILIGLTQSHFFTKEPTAGLQIETGSIPSSVFLNGQYLDKTNLVRHNLKPAEYVVEIRPDDDSLVSYQTSLTLRPSFLTVMTWKPGSTPEQSGGVIYEMERLADQEATEVIFSSIPDGAIIDFADFPTDFAPVTFKNVAPGEQAYSVSLPSYQTQAHSIHVAPGYRYLITIKLAKQQSYHSMPTPPASSSLPSTATASGLVNSSSSVIIKPTKLFINGVEVLRVRSNPNLNSSQLGTVKVGEKFALLTKQAGWVEIQIGTQSGWVSEAYVTTE